MLSALECRRVADDCEREAASVTQIAQVRQFRLLARSWRDLALEVEHRPPQEARSFVTGEPVERPAVGGAHADPTSPS